MAKKRKSRRAWPSKAICRDCGHAEPHFRFEFHKASPPRCQRCGGLLERSIHLRWAKSAESPATNLHGKPQSSPKAKVSPKATEANPTGTVAPGLVLDAAVAISRGRYSLRAHAKEAGKR